VNRRAGGHAGDGTMESLREELGDLGVPLVCAGGVAAPDEFAQALRLGYAGVQIGTRLIATPECRTTDAYKEAIVRATAADIVLSERVTGVPLAVIRTPYVERLGLRAGPVARWMLRGRRRKRIMRTIYGLRSAWRLKRASLDSGSSREFWQAGQSVQSIDRVQPVAEILGAYAAALDRE